MERNLSQSRSSFQTINVIAAIFLARAARNLEAYPDQESSPPHLGAGGVRVRRAHRAERRLLPI